VCSSVREHSSHGATVVTEVALRRCQDGSPMYPNTSTRAAAACVRNLHANSMTTNHNPLAQHANPANISACLWLTGIPIVARICHSLSLLYTSSPKSVVSSGISIGLVLVLRPHRLRRVDRSNVVVVQWKDLIVVTRRLLRASRAILPRDYGPRPQLRPNQWTALGTRTPIRVAIGIPPARR
jgi:hypothetical protein